MKFDSIRWQLVLSYVVMAVLTAGLVGLLAMTLLKEYVRAQTTEQMQANAQAIAQQAIPLMEPFPKQNALFDLVHSTSFLGQVRVRILDNQSQVIADSGLPGASSSMIWVQPDPRHQNRPPFMVPLSPRRKGSPRFQPWVLENSGSGPTVIVQVLDGPWGRRIVFETGANQQVFTEPDPATPAPAPAAADTRSVASVRYPIGDPARPRGYVQLESPSSTGEQIIAAMRRSLLWAGLAAVLTAVAAGLLVGRSFTAPILALASSANRMSSGDLSARAPVSGAGEIAQLAQQFNHMAERLQASFAALAGERDALRRFIADASHELRTPVTALGNFIELLQGPAADDLPARETFLAESQVQIQRMKWITNNLLDLSRLDAGLVRLDQTPEDVGELLQSTAAPFQQRALAKGIRLEVIPPAQTISIRCDRPRMQMAVGNLLDNALKFTSPGGQVVLRAEQQAGEVHIQVKDTGSGITPEDSPHIFERFYRGRTSQEGSGLGLAITQSIVQAHAGSISMNSQPGAGSTVTISLPGAVPDPFV